MSTPEQARRYRARKRTEKLAAGIFVRPQRHTRVSVAETLQRRSERHVNGCLLWTGPINKGGYGVIGIGGKRELIHRAAWWATHGAIPTGMKVCHTCDVRNCIDPMHLWLGTQAQNVADAVAKGRLHKLGGWNKGHPHSDETRAKMAARAQSRPSRSHTDETRIKLSLARAAWWERHKNAEAM